MTTARNFTLFNNSCLTYWELLIFGSSPWSDHHYYARNFVWNCFWKAGCWRVSCRIRVSGFCPLSWGLSSGQPRWILTASACYCFEKNSCFSCQSKTGFQTPVATQCHLRIALRCPNWFHFPLRSRLHFINTVVRRFTTTGVAVVTIAVVSFSTSLTTSVLETS